MTHVADDATIGKFTRRFIGLVERARTAALDLELLWTIIQGYLDGKFENIEGVLSGTHRIVEVEKRQLKPIDPLAEFFKTREGLYVSSDFTNLILAPAFAMGETGQATVGAPFNLPTPMVDAKIRKELGESHVFENARAFCLYLKGALERQWGGAEGNLLNNGYANLYYVRIGGEVFVVGASWGAGGRKWSVSAYRLDDDTWDARNRAFPAN